MLGRGCIMHIVYFLLKKTNIKARNTLPPLSLWLPGEFVDVYIRMTCSYKKNEHFTVVISEFDKVSHYDHLTVCICC